MNKELVLFFIILRVTTSFSQTPPDPPLAPQDWVDKMGIGSWWIFTIPPAPDTNITTNYSNKILDSLQTKFCFNGGRLHWVIESRNYSSYDANGDLPQSTIDYVGNIIDDFMQRDMAICLNIQFNNPDVIKDSLGQDLKTRMKNAWRKISQSFKGKSHNLAMSPVIEFHGWENLGNPARQDSLNVLYDELTTIFRIDNPTRIMSYKPWGAAKRAEFGTLDYPFGNDPLPNSGQAFYYVSSFSGSAGLGDWGNWSPTMSQADLDALHFQTINAGSSNPNNVWGIRAAVAHRAATGIPFWMDHWRPNYHKHMNDPANQWTMEQNIAYCEFFMDKIIEIGSAGAMFQTRTFWNDDTDDLIRVDANSNNAEIMSGMFMDMLEQRCSTTDIQSIFNQKSVSVYPNPTRNNLIIKVNELNDDEIKLYNIFGSEIFTKKTKINNDTFYIDIKEIPYGVYFLKVKEEIFKIIKK